MLSRSLPGLLGLVLVLSSISFSATAQEKTKAKSTKSEAAQKKSSTTEASPFRRLPAGYGALKLSDEQKEKVYAVREEYGKEIAELEQQIQALRQKMDKDCEGVLTSAQKQQLASSKSEKQKKEESDDSKSTSKKSKSTKSNSKSSSKSSDSTKE